MTTNKRAIEMLKNELACVGNPDCNREECRNCQLVMSEHEITEALHMAIKAIDQTRWIPVSEKLPEDRREVLVTAYWHETYQVMMASYYGDGLWWCVPFNNCGEHTQRLNPKAWMPLPKPYEPQKSEG